MTRVTCGHHVLGIKYLLRQLRHGQRTVLLAATRRQRSKAGHEEVQTWEWNHVDGQFTQVSVQLSHSTSNVCSNTLNWHVRGIAELPNSFTFNCTF